MNHWKTIEFLTIVDLKVVNECMQVLMYNVCIVFVMDLIVSVYKLINFMMLIICSMKYIKMICNTRILYVYTYLVIKI